MGGEVKFCGLCTCMGKTVTKSFNGKILQQITNLKENFMFLKEKTIDPRVLCAIYMYMLIIFKHFPETA